MLRRPEEEGGYWGLEMEGLAIFLGAKQQCQANLLSVGDQLRATSGEEDEAVAWTERCFGLVATVVMVYVQRR